jgi:hypothetical protein
MLNARIPSLNADSALVSSADPRYPSHWPDEGSDRRSIFTLPLLPNSLWKSPLHPDRLTLESVTVCHALGQKVAEIPDPEG